MKIRMGSLKRVIREMVLEEQIRLAQDSVDDQIDSILLKYETDSLLDQPDEEPMPTHEEPADEAFEGLINLGQLLEAPEDEEEEEDAADKPADEEGDADDEDPAPEEDTPPQEEPQDISDAQPDQEAETLTPSIDVSKFATKVTRLIDNFENLMDVPMAIATRAYNHLVNSYGEAVAQEFSDIMQQYGIETEPPVTSEPETLPIAVGAGASGLGGA